LPARREQVEFEIMAKLNSVPLYPIGLPAGDISVNLCKNKTPEGKFQIARVLQPGGPLEGEFEVLFEGDEPGADAFARQLVDKEYPGLRWKPHIRSAVADSFDELEDETGPPTPADLTRPLRRLAAAILLQAVEDMRYWNPNVRRDALLFLLPRDRYFREHLELMLTVSRTDQRSFRRWMSKFF
jgi:hypothetical protein